MHETPVFVTIPWSNYVEKARWAMQMAKIPFTEEKHVPGLHRFATSPHGGTSVPLLYFPHSKLALTDSTDILDYCARFEPSLYPTTDVKLKEKYFDKVLGPAVRVIAYFAMFKDSSLAREVIIRPTSNCLERALGHFLLEPFLRNKLFRYMSISEQGALYALDEVEKVVAEVDLSLGSRPLGSCFLAGDSFSAADIAFCAHFGLLLAPPENIYIKSLDKLITEPDIRARLAKLQRSQAAEFVYWCYKNYRPEMASDC